MDNNDKKEYKSPKLQVHGDLRKVTKNKKGIFDSLGNPS